MTLRLLLPLVLSATLAAQVPARAPRKPIFISPALVNAVNAIAPPAAANSKQMARDIAEIYALHHTATPEELAAANSDNEHEDIFAIGRVLGDRFKAESLPATTRFWNDVNNDLSIAVSAAKSYFQEVRPYNLDPVSLKSLCGSKPGGAKNSYPSGHASVGYTSAILLGMMVPEKAGALWQRADEYGHNRVVCGDHYAGDIPASKELAFLVIGNMAGNDQFQKELAAAKAELRQVLGM